MSESSRRDQRRRLLVAWKRSEPDTTPTAARELTRRAAGDSCSYAPEAAPERLRNPAVLIPVSAGRLALAATAILVPVVATITISAWEPVRGRALIPDSGWSERFAGTIAAASAGIDATAVTSLQAWLGQVFLLAAAGVALVVRLMRRHRRDDYHGRYRAWGWLATVLVMTACAGVVPVGRFVAAAASEATGIVLGPAGLGWWYAVASVAFLIVVPWAVLPLHERRGTVGWMTLAVLAWATSAVAGGTQVHDEVAAARFHAPIVLQSAWVAAAAFALVAMLTAARSVIREVRGLATRREPRKEKARDAARTRPATTSESPKAVAAPSRADIDPDDDDRPTDETATVEFVDGSESDRRLSKAERKRLRKLERMQAAA
jgi:hypothetical protein